jgi:hypothetical protein
MNDDNPWQPGGTCHTWDKSKESWKKAQDGLPYLVCSDVGQASYDDLTKIKEGQYLSKGCGTQDIINTKTSLLPYQTTSKENDKKNKKHERKEKKKNRFHAFRKFKTNVKKKKLTVNIVCSIVIGILVSLLILRLKYPNTPIKFLHYTTLDNKTKKIIYSTIISLLILLCVFFISIANMKDGNTD